MYQYKISCVLPLSIPSIRTIGTLGQYWDIPIHQYTCMFTTVCPVHIVGTLGQKWRTRVVYITINLWQPLLYVLYIPSDWSSHVRSAVYSNSAGQ